MKSEIWGRLYIPSGEHCNWFIQNATYHYKSRTLRKIRVQN